MIPGPAVWPVVLQILFVIDGRITTNDGSNCFGLKLVLDTLRDTSFAPWVRFKVDVVRRDSPGKDDAHPDYRLCAIGDNGYTAPGDSVPFEHFGFTFTEPKFKIDDYDQIWFFGDYPMNSTELITDPSFSPMADAELRVLAEWMDRGGGVFAVGDHFNLGASMCSRIPRVRTMRKWTEGQGVPSQFGDDRNETLQLVPASSDDAREGDATPQTIEPVFRARATSILARPLVPHPLLCAPGGAIINKFPDHMHEGEVINDDEVVLDSPLGIPNYHRLEYPFDVPVVAQAEVADAVAVIVEPPRPRARPHVVAYGRTTNTIGWPQVPPGTANPGVAFAGARLPTRTFGLISAYDGDRAGIGRVVVESTWHHWFSFNLHGLRDWNPVVYENMQAYYRNVALWLATPAQRQSMLIAAAWGPVVSDPMAFPPESSKRLWAVGERVVNIISRTASPCTISEFVASFFDGRAEEIFAVPDDLDASEPCRTCLPADLAERAIVGGIASALIQPATDYYKARGSPRRLLDPEAIASHAAAGAKRGQRALLEAVQPARAASKETVGRLKDAFRLSLPASMPIDLVPLRVTAERLQLPDLTDPALAGNGATITIRLTISGSVVASDVFERAEIPSPTNKGVFIDLNRVIYDGFVQSGETLTLEVIAGQAERLPATAQQLRFSDTVADEPATWIGSHTPSQAQLWRLWYRIEDTRSSGK